MTRPLSTDLRERLISAVEGGMSRRSAAKRFGVAASTAIKWFAQWRQTGDVRPRPQGGDHRSHRIEAHAGEILALVEETPDITLAEAIPYLAPNAQPSRPGLLLFFTENSPPLSAWPKKTGPLKIKEDSRWLRGPDLYHFVLRFRLSFRSPGKRLRRHATTFTEHTCGTPRLEQLSLNQRVRGSSPRAPPK